MSLNNTDERKGLPRWIGFLLLILLLPLALLFLATYLVAGLFLNVLVWATWFPRGRSVLIVTSDSPVWSHYMTERVVRVLGPKATVLNWSERSQWGSLANVPVILFRYYGHTREFNPLVIVFKALRPARVFRFWKPFKEYKHGKPQAVESLTEELLRYTGILD
jgi:hypothetical protein